LQHAIKHVERPGEATLGSQALRLPRFNFEDGRAGFSSACRASTFMAVQGSQVLRPSRKKLKQLYAKKDGHVFPQISTVFRV